MGVDTYIFDEHSKECFYFDRNHNFFCFVNLEVDDPVYDKVMYHRNAGRNRDVRFTAAEVAHCCDINIDYWNKYGSQQYRAGWNESIKRFVTERPDGQFFFRNDHQEPPSWHVRDGKDDFGRPTGGPVYVEVYACPECGAFGLCEYPFECPNQECKHFKKVGE